MIHSSPVLHDDELRPKAPPRLRNSARAAADSHLGMRRSSSPTVKSLPCSPALMRRLSVPAAASLPFSMPCSPVDSPASLHRRPSAPTTAVAPSVQARASPLTSELNTFKRAVDEGASPVSVVSQRPMHTRRDAISAREGTAWHSFTETHAIPYVRRYTNSSLPSGATARLEKLMLSSNLASNGGRATVP